MSELEYTRVYNTEIMTAHIDVYKKRVLQWQEARMKRGDSPPMLLIVGETGIGKSAILSEVLKNLGFKYIVQEGLPGFVQEPQDLLGMPVVKDDRTVNIPPSPLTRAAELGKKGLTALVLDEFTQLQHHAIYNAIQDLLDSYKSGSLTLKNVVIFGISNPWNDARYANSIEPGDQMKKRLKVLHMEFDHKAWCAWAAGREDLLPSLVEYFSQNKELMQDVRTNANTVTEAARCLKICCGTDEDAQSILESTGNGTQKTVVLNELYSTIGQSATGGYIGYLSTQFKKVPRVEEVVEVYQKDSKDIMETTFDNFAAQNIFLVRTVQYLSNMSPDSDDDPTPVYETIRDILLDRRLSIDLIPPFASRLGKLPRGLCRDFYKYLARQKGEHDIFKRIASPPSK